MRDAPLATWKDAAFHCDEISRNPYRPRSTHTTWFPSARYIMRACILPIYSHVTPLYRRDRARNAAEYQKHTPRNAYNLSAVWETRIYRRYKIAPKEKGRNSSFIDAARSRSNSSLIKIFTSRRLFPITFSYAVTVRALSISCARRYFWWESSSRQYLHIEIRRAIFYTSQSVATTYPRALARPKMFSFLLSTDVCFSILYAKVSRNTETRFLRIYFGLRRRSETLRGKRGLDQLSTSRAVRSLSAAEIGPNRVNGKLCKLQRKNE